MTSEPDQIRARIDAVLTELPELADDGNGLTDADIEEVARRLSEAHDVLVHALESVEKG